MDAVLLARTQFAFTVAFHYLFPPLSIGLGLLLVAFEGMYLKTKDPLWERITRFWVGIFGLIFAFGVATGIVMEFQFGTNWSTYSRYVGDIFGSPLAAEGVFAFFLESTFLGVLVFGWKRVSPRVHFLSTVMVAFGAALSALWIIIANSWQQTPAGFQLVGEGATLRAELVDFWAAALNPSTVARYTHVIVAAWQTGAFLVLGVGAWHALKRQHLDFARASMKPAIVLAVVASLGQLWTGHHSAGVVAEHQPAKLAAFEGHYADGQPGDLYAFGWVDEDAQRVVGLGLPGGLSLLLHGDTQAGVTGLSAFAPEDRPPVQPVFQAYHLMVALGMALIAASLLAAFSWWRGSLWHTRWLLGALIASSLLPTLGNQVGWFAAEVGRQPWIVQGLLRTKDAVSVVVPAWQVLASLLLFGVLYTLMFVLFVYLFAKKASRGPTPAAAE
jgi:cytochrome d ubiquinol oxidase subunit I